MSKGWGAGGHGGRRAVATTLQSFGVGQHRAVSLHSLSGRVPVTCRILVLTQAAENAEGEDVIFEQ